MKKNKTTWVMVLFFFIGLSVLLYPSISNFYNSRVQSKAIVDYEAILKNYDEDKYKEFFDKANNYNNKLKKLASPFTSHTTIKNYNDILNIDGTGMMGYITIEKIKSEGNEIHIITARSEPTVIEPYNITKDFLDENNIAYDKIVVNCKDKYTYCKENDIDIMIDDEPRNINSISEIMPVIAFEGIHNEECVGTNIIKVNTWDEVYEEYLKLL